MGPRVPSTYLCRNARDGHVACPMKIGCSGLERLLLLLSAGAAINAAPAASSAAAAADAASLVDLPHSFVETLHTKLPPNGHHQENNFFQDL